MATQLARTTTLSPAARLADDPVEFFGGSHTQAYGMNPYELGRLQLEALRMRYDQFQASIPFVGKLCERTGIDRIELVEDVVPLLFDHTVYKGYPPALLEQGRFDLLTKWLDSLTALDLSDVDASGCTSIDGWLALLDAETDLRVAHTAGTTGTMSFLPYTVRHLELFIACMGLTFFKPFGSEEDWREDDPVHVIWPYFAEGNMGGQRNHAAFVKLMCGGREDRMHSVLPGRISSDVLYFAARLQAATTRGQAHTLKVPPDLLARKAEIEQTLGDMPSHLQRFLAEDATSFRGERVFVLGTWKMVHDLSTTGLAAGCRDIFAPDSVVLAAGGAKGWTPPPNWKDDVKAFFGVSALEHYFGMSEVTLIGRLCSEARYHLSPWIIPFVLDPDSGDILPRTGVVTGRGAYYDLMAGTHWGGFITGDEITMHWSADCACGRTAPFVEEHIERFSVKRGGDDKITCVATPEAHREALNFIAESSEGL